MNSKNYSILLLLFFSVSLHAQQRDFSAAALKKDFYEQSLFNRKPDLNHLIRPEQSAGIKYRLDSVTDKYDGGGIWVDGSTLYYSYNSLSLLESAYGVHPQTETLTKYFYNAAGQLVKEWNKSGDSLNSNWSYKIKTEYGYYPNSDLSYMIDYSWKSSLNQWAPYDSIYFYYNNAGQDSTAIQYVWSASTNTWDKKNKVDYLYNSGQISHSVTQAWDTTLNTWQGKSTRTYYSNSNGLIRKWTAAFYRSATATWDSTYKAEYTYDQNFNPIEEVYISFYTPTQQWIKVSRFTYQYDNSVSFNDLIAPSRDQLTPDERHLINNKPVSFQDAMWDGNQSQWNVLDSIYYHYSEQVVSLTESANQAWKYYPNPASTEVYFELPEGKSGRVEIYNAAGQLVIDSRLSHSGALDIKSLKSGIYILRIYCGSKYQEGKLQVD